MFQKLEREWQRFRRSKPGRRFQQRYEEKQRSRRGMLRKVLVTASGALIFATGIFLLAMPGPGTVLLVIGGGLIAEESRLAARALDWAEVRLRKLCAWSLRLWKGASSATRVVLVICALLIGVSLAFGAYKIAFAG
jgi:uncharacterized protein (TIGR02611 family)